MDYFHEALALGIDLIVFAFCFREYRGYKKTLAALKVAPQLSIDGNLNDLVDRQKGKKIPYVVLRGVVSPIGASMRSVMSPSVTGVIQIIKLSEHRVARGFAGFWTEQRKLIHVSSNEIPFKIVNGDHGVEVMDGLSAAILDLDIVGDNYEPSSLSFMDNIFGFVSGIRQKGLQTTEEMLRDGSFITCIGELELEGKTLRLQSSSTGPMFLTTATKRTLLTRLQDAKSSMVLKMIVCGTISLVLVTLMGRRFYQKKKQEREERRIRETLEKSRLERRSRIRPKNLLDEQLCVVCVSNPKEIIVLPCGHVCLCEDCSLKITASCPVCRTKISTKAAAFIT